MLKATSVPQTPQTPQTSHSQYSSLVKALNLIVALKSRPVELDNSTIELNLPRAAEAKEKLAIILFCGLLMPFDMTFDVKLRD